MERIDIGTVLNKFNDTVDERTNAVKFYGIRALNDRGEKREYICRKNIKSPKQQKENTPANDRGVEMFNLKRNGVMLIKAQNEDHPRTIRIAVIYSFKDFQSNTWLKVFH